MLINFDRLVFKDYKDNPLPCNSQKSGLLTERIQIQGDAEVCLLDLRAFALSNKIDDKRLCERSGLLYLLKKELGAEEIDLHHTNNGKPFLRSSLINISVSHSHGLLALAWCKHAEIGVDVELIRDKVLRLRHKFLSDAEQQYAQANDVEKNLIFWSAKESMFKLYAKGGVDFIEHLKISNFDRKESGIFSAQILMKDCNMNLQVEYRILKEHVFTCTIPNSYEYL